jgi:hypothetical protein
MNKIIIHSIVAATIATASTTPNQPAIEPISPIDPWVDAVEIQETDTDNMYSKKIHVKKKKVKSDNVPSNSWMAHLSANKMAYGIGGGVIGSAALAMMWPMIRDKYGVGETGRQNKLKSLSDQAADLQKKHDDLMENNKADVKKFIRQRGNAKVVFKIEKLHIEKYLDFIVKKHPILNDFTESMKSVYKLLYSEDQLPMLSNPNASYEIIIMNMLINKPGLNIDIALIKLQHNDQLKNNPEAIKLIDNYFSNMETEMNKPEYEHLRLEAAEEALSAQKNPQYESYIQSVKKALDSRIALNQAIQKRDEYKAKISK